MDKLYSDDENSPLKKKYIGVKVIWNTDYGDGLPKEIVTIHSLCYKSGFDKLNKPVFLNECQKKYTAKELDSITDLCPEILFDKLNNPVFFDKDKERYMELDYVKKYRIDDDEYLGWYAKNKVGNLFQFQWQENDDLHILKSDGKYYEVDKSDYEIINIKMITERG